MNTKIYVENLAAETTENELKDLFSTYGNVGDVNIAVEGVERKSRGFACVTMVTPEATRDAIQALNGKTLGTATITVTKWWSSLRTNSSSPSKSGKKIENKKNENCTGESP
jgi:RNA recognition motif-containing protein